MTPKLKIEGTGATTQYRFRATGPVTPTNDTEPNDEAGDHEARGEIVGGTDTYSFSGVPMDFTAVEPANAWTLDLALDMGAGFVEQVPTDLNAGHIEVRGEGHYRLWIPEPGMILRDELADKPDQIGTGPNTMAVGNVRGGTDSWRAWPPEAVMCKSDTDCEYRIANNTADDSWKPMETISTTMDF